MTLESFCREHDFAVLETSRGLSLVSSSGAPLTLAYPCREALFEDARRHAEAIALAATLDPPTDAFKRRYLHGLAEARAEIADVEKRCPALLDRLAATTKASAEDELAEEMLELVSKIQSNIPVHREVLHEAKRTAEECPVRLVLPLGAVVRLRSDYDYPDYCALDPRRRTARRIRPVAGTSAFVGGNGFCADEAGVVLLFTGAFDAVGEGPWNHPSGPYGYPLRVRPEDVEIVSLATDWDGAPFRGVEVVPSHRARYPDGDSAGSVLVLHSGGRVLCFSSGKRADPRDEGVAIYKDGKTELELCRIGGAKAA